MSVSDVPSMPTVVPATKRWTWPYVRHAMSTTRLPLVQLLVLAAVFTWGSLQMEGFATASSIRASLVIASILSLTALGQTLVILTGGLDMATPGYIAVGAVAAVVLPGRHGWPLWAAAVLVIAVAGLAGAVSGAICHVLKVQPLVLTLGMSAVLTGGVLIVTGAEFMGSPPALLTEMTSTQSTTVGVPLPPVVSVALVTISVVSLFLSRTAAGRSLYAAGSNPVAAEGVMIRVGLVRVATFAGGAALTGLSGMLVAGFASGATLAIGEPYFFTGLAAVLVGGTALGSAQGSFLRTAIGALTLTLLTTILAGQGLGDGDRRVLFGAMILLVVLIYAREPRLRDRL